MRTASSVSAETAMDARTDRTWPVTPTIRPKLTLYLILQMTPPRLSSEQQRLSPEAYHVAVEWTARAAPYAPELGGCAPFDFFQMLRTAYLGEDRGCL
jgi:hypothetical protein